MTIQLDLQPDVERGLLAQARLHGMTLQEYIQQIVTREAHRPPTASASRPAANLVELSEPVRGLLTDEEVDTLFRRDSSISRPIDLA
jgi:hypothetical protein